MSNEFDDIDDKSSWEKVLECFEPGYLKGRCLPFPLLMLENSSRKLKRTVFGHGLLVAS